MKRMTKRNRGFTLLEALIVVGIMFVLMGIAIIQSFGSRESYLANSAMDTVVSQMRLARELAITQRRNVKVTIVANPGPGLAAHVDYQILAAPGSKEANGPVVPAIIPVQTSFMLTAGVPDTPMNFGNSAPIYIGNVSGGPPFMEFTSTGQFTDNTGFNTLNGTIFIGITGQKNTARAVTVMGGTGRVRPYTYTGTSWID